MSTAEQAALLSALLALRELAARVVRQKMAKEGNSEPTPETQERGALAGLAARLRLRSPADIAVRETALQDNFHAQLSQQLRGLLQSLPLSAGKMLMALVRVDSPAGRSELQEDLGESAYDAWECAWSDVLGQPLASWVCSAPSISQPAVPPTAALPLLRSVQLPQVTNGGTLQPAPPERLDLAHCWSGAVQAARMLPPVEAVGWRVWMDALDSLLERTLGRVPVFAGEETPRDTLVDATRLSAAVAACGVSARASSGGDLDCLRLVSIEFTPIQDFVFAVQPQSPWRTDAALGGRSSFVRLTVDLAALAVLDRMGLPSCCQLNSAASKSLLLLPDSPHVRLELTKLANSFDAWALRQLAGSGGLCVGHIRVKRAALSIRPAASDSESTLPLERLARQSAENKLRRFGLSSNVSPLLSRMWDDLQRCRAFCSLDGVTPGAVRNSEGLDTVCAERLDEAPPLSPSARMQLSLGRDLGVADVLVVHRRGANMAGDPDQPRDWHFGALTLSLVTGAAALDPRTTLAAWDIAYGTRPPRERHFKGLAIRPIALPRGRWQGGTIAMLKGDLDRLGQIFRTGLDRATLARSIRLSREVDDFFSIYVPVLMQQAFPAVQTVLCGGDDFVFVGPAELMPTVATRLYQEFQQHCNNPSLTFSAGLCVAEVGMSLSELSEAAEAALEEAKRERASICAHGVSVRWSEWMDLGQLQERIAAELRGEVTAKVEFLERACAIIDTRNQTRHFAGQRVRERLRSAISAFVGQGHSRQQDVEDPQAQRRRFWRLVALIETCGVLRHAGASRIPLQNLLLVYRTARSRARGRREELA